MSLIDQKINYVWKFADRQTFSVYYTHNISQSLACAFPFVDLFMSRALLLPSSPVIRANQNDYSLATVRLVTRFRSETVKVNTFGGYPEKYTGKIFYQLDNLCNRSTCQHVSRKSENSYHCHLLLFCYFNIYNVAMCFLNEVENESTVAQHVR